MSEYFEIDTEDMFFYYANDKVPNPDDFKMHTHPKYEIFYFISGDGIHWVEGNGYDLKSGDLLIMNSNEAHYIEIKPTVPYKRCVIQFKKEFIRKIDNEGILLTPFEARQPGQHNLFRRKDFESDIYVTFFNNIIKNAKDKNISLITNFFPLLDEILKAFENNKKLSFQTNDTIINQIINYIMDNISSELSLDLLCKRFYISKSQLCRSFKKSTGSSLWEYITIKRLIKAKTMIDEGAMPTKIFLECGFSDYSVFFRAYKKHFGCSPRN